jgi:hypothetical protein
MATKHLRRIGLGALWFAPVVIIPVAFFVSLPWLNQQNDAIELGVIAAFAILLMGYSLFLAERINRRLDEVQITGQRFATTKGMTIGTGVAGLVMVLSMDALVDLANTIGPSLGSSPDKAVKLGIVFGYMLVVIFQLLGTIAVAIWWERRIYGGRA